MINSGKDINETFAFGPNALLNALGNSLTSPLLNKVFKVKGIFKIGKGINYNGFYYDLLKDEFSDTNITLVIPLLLRKDLKDGQIIEAFVYLTKRSQTSNARIELVLTVNEIITKKDNVINEQEIRSLDLIQRKAKVGYKDVDTYIKTRIFEQSKINITIVIGLTAIIDHDIRHQIKDAAVAFNFKFVRINLTQPGEIIKALKENDSADILVISRGGGENIQIFDNLTISEEAISLQSIFITAIGHSSDEPLLQRVADKAFITPTALGQYFQDIYNNALEQLNNSKAKLIADLSKQIEISFQNKISDLNNRLEESIKTREVLSRNTKDQIDILSNQLIKSKTTNAALFTLVILMLTAITIYFIIKAASK